MSAKWQWNSAATTSLYFPLQPQVHPIVPRDKVKRQRHVNWHLCLTLQSKSWPQKPADPTLGFWLQPASKAALNNEVSQNISSARCMGWNTPEDHAKACSITAGQEYDRVMRIYGCTALVSKGLGLKHIAKKMLLAKKWHPRGSRYQMARFRKSHATDCWQQSWK